MADEWLSFEQAGQLIEGPAGWQRTATGGRQAAQTMLLLAHKGKVAVRATSWHCRMQHSAVGKVCDQPPDEREKSEFLLMLFAREKGGNDSWASNIGPGLSVHGAFALADEVRGVFEASRVLNSPNGQSITHNFVTGLSYLRADIEASFDCLGSVDRASKGGKSGRPIGSGGFVAIDAALVEKMRELIDQNPGMTPNRAAAHFVAEAAGTADFEGKQKRLAKRYRTIAGK